MNSTEYSEIETKSIGQLSKANGVHSQALFLIVALVVGLVSGFGVDAFARPVTNTVTSISISGTTTTVTVPVTVTSLTTTTAYMTQTTRRFLTTTVTSIIRTTTSQLTTSYITTTLRTTETVRITQFTTVYPAERGALLVTDRGSGDKETRPFTLNATSDLRLKLTITARADLRYVGLSWYLYRVGSEVSFKRGSIDEEQGNFEFYMAAIPPGNWYVKILAANCNWQLSIKRVT